MIANTPPWTFVAYAATVMSPNTLIPASAIHASARPTPPVATAGELPVKTFDCLRFIA